VSRHRIDAQSGVAFTMTQGDHLRVIDPLGEQVADCIVFSRADLKECLSSGRTLDYNNTIRLTTGHILYSNRSRPLLTITADSVGCHDFLYTPCSQETFDILYKVNGHHPSCFENLSERLHPYGIEPDQIPTTFNIFMNVEVGASGELRVLPPLSRPGDFIELRAEADLLVGLTACSAELSNNFAFKPIDFELIAASETNRQGE
jgi:uncharacterized protein YcgI (DUF1989 family)